MAVRRSPVRWALILLVVGLVGVAAVVALWWPRGSAEVRRVAATVVTSSACSGADAYDRVELKIGDETRQARLDGCGHQENEVVDVVVPADTSGDLLVQAASTTPRGMPFPTRLSAMLMCLSGLAGGLYAYLVRRPVQLTASAEAA